MSRLKPFGIGDLVVLKKRLVGYSAGEIAHIENVMAFERRSREHRRLERQELTLETEFEREEEQKRDLESSERFELEQEIQKEVEKQMKFSAGVEVSGGFGPMQISAYARLDLSETSRESEKTAQKYAKEITERAMERLREKSRELRRSIETRETEETNTHGFKNISADPASGIYRWVDKQYLVKPTYYGKRLFYELIIPEPAALYVFQKMWHLNNNALPEKPEQPLVFDLISMSPISFGFRPLRPADINDVNYHQLVAQYDVEDVDPPPAESLFVSHSIAKEVDPSKDFLIEGESVQIPDGYVGKHADVVMVFKGWASHAPERDFRIPLESYPDTTTMSYANIQIGQHTDVTWQAPTYADFNGEKRASLGLNDEVGQLVISGVGNFVGAFAINLRVECQPSATLVEKWQLDTFAAINNAYRRKLSQYEEKLASAAISGGVKISGNNPDINLKTIKDELKKSFIEFWLQGDFDSFDGWTTGNAESTPPDLPRLNISDTFSKQDAVYFAEESMDWDNLSFKFLPYFNGRKSRWIDLLNYEDTDPLFENFLKAGAALVRVPVRPTHTHAVLYYQLTNVIWPRSSGPVPALSPSSGPEADLYNSYLSEVAPEADFTDALEEIDISPDDDGVFRADVPTRLIWLQQSDDLNPDAEDS